GRSRRSRVHNAGPDVHRAARMRVRAFFSLTSLITLGLSPSHRTTRSARLGKKPRLTQHYCVEYVSCLRFKFHFTLVSHQCSKVHKRRCKQLKELAYAIEESERVAGLGCAEARPRVA
ncbi:hypothetical protein K438DRAFT_1449083, partial [Mycena galopus ATCC 62051]